MNSVTRAAMIDVGEIDVCIVDDVDEPDFGDELHLSERGSIANSITYCHRCGAYASGGAPDPSGLVCCLNCMWA